MGGTLHIGADMINGDVETLRQLLADHTDSPREAAALLTELAIALRSGPVHHVVVLPAKASDPDGGALHWRMRITHAPLEVEL
ncbi:MAG TPA: hypothetical protein VMN78_00655 [Longimicrobiales bacterium]|nr:hypothetical protein [Longimicrobiales bacterium]